MVQVSLATVTLSKPTCVTVIHAIPENGNFTSHGPFFRTNQIAWKVSFFEWEKVNWLLRQKGPFFTRVYSSTRLSEMTRRISVNWFNKFNCHLRVDTCFICFSINLLVCVLQFGPPFFLSFLLLNFHFTLCYTFHFGPLPSQNWLLSPSNFSCVLLLKIQFTNWKGKSKFSIRIDQMCKRGRRKNISQGPWTHFHHHHHPLTHTHLHEMQNSIPDTHQIH